MFSLFLLAAIPGQFIENDPTFPKDRQQAVLEATVRITLPATRDHGAPVATGVVVRRDGQLAYVLTADHVLAVEAGREPVIETFTTKSTPFPNAKATSVAISERMPEVDLAILRIELSNPPAALRICPKNEAARLESPTEQRPVPVLTSGIGGGFDSPFLRRDRVIGLRQAKPGSPAWFFEAETAPVAGRSGGPLVDERGYLIGICSGTRGGKGYYISVGEIHTALEPKKLGWLVDGKPNH